MTIQHIGHISSWHALKCLAYDISYVSLVGAVLPGKVIWNHRWVRKTDFVAKQAFTILIFPCKEYLAVWLDSLKLRYKTLELKLWATDTWVDMIRNDSDNKMGTSFWNTLYYTQVSNVWSVCKVKNGWKVEFPFAARATCRVEETVLLQWDWCRSYLIMELEASHGWS